jgi:hypothetical protein
MKKYLDSNFIIGFMWFCILQPVLFLFGVSVFVFGIYQSIWS